MANNQQGSTNVASEPTSEALIARARNTFIACVVLCLALLISYGVFFRDLPFVAEAGPWAEFGEFFGGVIGPAVGLATVYLVLITAKLQKRELQTTLAETRRANASAAKQSFEQTLFSWLSKYSELLQSIEDTRSVPFSQPGTRETIHGRQALYHWYETFFSARFVAYDINSAQGNYGVPNAIQGNRIISGLKDEQKPDALNSAISHYANLADAQRYQLDAFFRTLFRLIVWIDGSETLDTTGKYFYVSLVRAQLSWIELAFLLYNGLMDEGSAFIRYANKYALFDNLYLPKDEVLKMIAERTDLSKYEPEAFNSELAKLALFHGNPGSPTAS